MVQKLTCGFDHARKIAFECVGRKFDQLRGLHESRCSFHRCARHKGYTAHQIGFLYGEFHRDRATILDTQQVDLPQPEIGRKIAHGLGIGCPDVGTRSGVRFTTARPIRRVHRTIFAQDFQELVEHAAGPALRMNAQQGREFIETARAGKRGAHMQLAESAIKIGAAGTNICGV